MEYVSFAQIGFQEPLLHDFFDIDFIVHVSIARLFLNVGHELFEDSTVEAEKCRDKFGQEG